MNYFHIQGIERKISQLILGTDYYKPEILDSISEIMDEFVRIGGTTLDTAYVYSGGGSETAIGMWMAERKNRSDVVILTKGAHHNADGPRVNREAIYSDLMTSLERLQTDHVELYALHRDDPNVPVGAIIEALNEHIEAGRAGAVGASNWSCRRLQEANDYAAEHGLKGFSFNSPNLSLAKAKEPFWAGCVSADAADCSWHEEKQMPLLSWSSQARGFFTGRFGPDDRSNPDLVRVFFSDENWERFRRAEQMAKDKHASTIQIALAYVLNQPFPAGALIGPQNLDELHSCHEATNLHLTRDELEWLENGHARFEIEHNLET